MTIEKKPPRGRKITTQTSGKTPTEPSGTLARTARDAASRYRELLAHLPVGVYRTTMKGELVERANAAALVFRLAREERDAWLNWPVRVAALMAAELGVEPHPMQKILETQVRTHLSELAEIRPEFR